MKSLSQLSLLFCCRGGFCPPDDIAQPPPFEGGFKGDVPLGWLFGVVGYTIIAKRTSPLPPSKGGGCAMS